MESRSGALAARHAIPIREYRVKDFAMNEERWRVSARKRQYIGHQGTDSR